MSSTALSRDFDSDTYNALLSVEESNRLARADGGLAEFLESASKLFVASGMHERFGVALLHKHNAVEAGERMIQYEGVVGGEKALITRPVSEETGLDEEVPSIWKLSDGRFLPLEFTSDSLARDLFSASEPPEGFLNAFSDLLKSSRAGRYFGLAVVEREFCQSAKANEVGLEFTNPEARSKIVFLRSRGASANSIETQWTFDGHVDTVSGGIVAETTCAATCRFECIVDDPVDRPPTHSRVHFDHHVQRPD